MHTGNEIVALSDPRVPAAPSLGVQSGLPCSGQSSGCTLDGPRIGARLGGDAILHAASDNFASLGFKIGNLERCTLLNCGHGTHKT